MMNNSSKLLSPTPFNNRPQTLTKPNNSPKQQQQSYRQPVGTSRSNSVASATRPRSWSEPLSSSKGKQVVPSGKKRVVFCDVVLERVERMNDGTWALPECK